MPANGPISLKEVVDHLGGGPTKLSRRLGLKTSSAVTQWHTAGGIPPAQARNVSVILGIPILALPVRWAELPDGQAPSDMEGDDDVPIAA